MDDAPRPPTLGEFVHRYLRKIVVAFGVADLVSGAIGVWLAYVFRDSPKAMSDQWAWQIPIYTLAAIGLSRILAAPYLIWRDERRRVVVLSDHLRPKVAVVSEPSCPGCVPFGPVHYPAALRAARRIGVANVCGASVSGVLVRIEEISPRPHDLLLPAYLRPIDQARTMASMRGVPVPAAPAKQSMTINALGGGHDHMTFVVASGVDANAPEMMGLDLAGHSSVVLLSPTSSYTGLLILEGFNATAVYADFTLRGLELELRPRDYAWPA